MSTIETYEYHRERATVELAGAIKEVLKGRLGAANEAIDRAKVQMGAMDAARSLERASWQRKEKAQ